MGSSNIQQRPLTVSWSSQLSVFSVAEFGPAVSPLPTLLYCKINNGGNCWEWFTLSCFKGTVLSPRCFRAVDCFFPRYHRGRGGGGVS